ncbi:MAG: hypothetical protein ACI3YT_00465 [Prevotella sp.]
MELKDKEIECIEKIVSTDRRYIDNREWLEEMDEEYRIGHPSVVWAEAMILADTIQGVEHGQNIVFARWGIGMREKELYAVRMMAIYLLEHPTDHRKSTNLDELGRMKSLVGLDDNRRTIDYQTGCMAAECFVIDYIKRKTLKRLIKELIDISKPFGVSFLGAVFALVSAFNRDLGGELDDEEDKVWELINKTKKEMGEVRKQLEAGVSVFSDEQVDHSGIVKDKRLWLDMMYGMACGDYRLKSNKEINDEDLCVGFLVVLRANDEYDDKGGYDSFFRMMAQLMNIEMSEKEKSRIMRYIQKNGVDYNNWADSPEKRYIRKEIAKDLMFLFTEKKKDLGFIKKK